MHGAGGATRIAGALVRRASHAVGSFKIELATLLATAYCMPQSFPIETTGPASETSFNLLGIGPLGLIIEVTGEWQA